MKRLSLSLLRYSLYNEFGIKLQAEEIDKNPWGKPFLRNYKYIQYNISHCSSAIVCSLSSLYPIGVDVENVRSYSPYSFKRCFQWTERCYVGGSMEPEREFFRLWTLKESYIKAIGMGMAYPMREICFDIRNGIIFSNRPGCRFVLMENDDGIIISCCYGVGREKENGRLYSV